MTAPSFSDLQRMGYARPTYQQQPSPFAMRKHSNQPGYTPQSAGIASDQPTDAPPVASEPTQPPPTTFPPPGGGTGGGGTGGGTPGPLPSGTPGGGTGTVPQPPTPWAPQNIPDLLQQLYQQWANYQAYGPFSFNPFQPGQYQPPQLGPGYQSSGAPTPQYSGQFQPGQGINPQIQQAVLGALGQPSRYGAEEVQGAFERANRMMGQEFGAQRQRVDEEMASRGLYYSTPAMGRLGDLAVRQSQAQADVATRLLEDQARQYQADRASAIGQAMGYGGQAFGQQLGGYQANLAGRAQNFNQDLAARALAGDQEAQRVLSDLSRAQYGLGAQAQQYGQNLTTQQQNFNQAMQQYLANLGTGSQSFNEQQQLLQNLLGYGQQGFQNQLSTAQFNFLQDQAYQEWLMRLLGMS